jgi:HSP20 family protein
MSEEFFREFDRLFREEMRRIRKMITELTNISSREWEELSKSKRPVVFGFTYRWSTGMEKPDIRFFGNVKPKTPFGMKIEDTVSPAYDIIDKDNHYEIVIELAGVRKEDVELSVRDDKLHVKATSPYRTYEGMIPVPQDAVTEDIEAKMNNGILVIKLKKSKDKRERKINIE